MRIVIHFPRLNGEAAIAGTIADIREATREMGDVVVLVVDEGSTDRTVAEAFATFCATRSIVASRAPT